MTGQSEERGPGNRLLLNVCKGMRNIIERDVIRTEMAKVTDLIFDKLKDHYGPFSSFAGLDSNQPLEETVFTKDGANIIRAMEFISPQEDWVRRAVSYIGKRMEKAAGDGTTSSMMFTCGMLKHMSKTIDQFRPLSYIQLRQAYDEFVNDIREGMKDRVFSAKNSDGTYDRDKVRVIAYNQAYTSSHGNVALAKAVAGMFYGTPPSMWSKMTFARKNYESDKQFEIMESEHQYEMEADIWNKSMFNRGAGAWLELEKTSLLVINDTLMIDSIYWKTIKEEIEKSSREHPLVILSKGNIDGATWGELTEYATGRNGKPEGLYFTVICGKAQPHATVNDFTVVQALAGADVSEYTKGQAGGDRYGIPYVVRDVYVKLQGDRLSLDNLYEDTREKVDYVRDRPMVSDTTKPYFSEFLESIQKAIEGLELFDLTRQQQLEMKHLEKMYNLLRYDKNLTLVIGGATFDNIAMFDVADDVIRATIKSLENGAVVSNNKALYNTVQDLLHGNSDYFKCESDDPNDHKPKIQELKRWLAEQVINTLDQFAIVMLNMLYPNGRKTIRGEQPKNTWYRFLHWDEFHNVVDPFGVGTSPMEFIPIPCDVDYRFENSDIREWIRWWFRNSIDVLRYNNSEWWTSNEFYRCDDRGPDKLGMIIQPSNADIVMLERFGEISLRFILTERVIVSGAAYVNKEPKK